MRRYIHTVDAVFALILFCAFAVSMLMVLTTGATAYQGVRNAVENHYSEHTCVNYVTMKARHFDADDIYFDEIDGINALCLRETFDGTDYITAIYYYDGSVREVYAESADMLELVPENGFEIVAAKSLDMRLSGGLLYLRCVGTGGGIAETSISVGGRVAA